ncbi:unnamed protein product, partial [Scytosiphon promiscuus]
MVEVRRGSKHIDSYNWVIQQCTRSNMDIKVILGDGDARGLVYYILMYSTKSTRTVSTIVPLLADAVDRMQTEGEDKCESERARKHVQSCLCKVLSGTELGAPAAVCKFMGWSDTIKSH